jgi:Ca2+-transporting ATPase
MQDSLLIAAIVLANGIIGFVQEQRAERAVAALKKFMRPTARAWREGALTELPVEQIVPGDLVELRGGDLVPADGRVVAANELQADESPLTGESMPVDETAETLQTPLQRRLAALSKRLAAAVVIVCAIVFIVGVLRGNETVEQMFLMAVSLAVAAVPEGLPAVITVALALGSQRMSKRRAIVRQLAADTRFGQRDL